MERYFVTGGAGFIGSHLVDRLMTRGAVTVYDNLSSGKKEFIHHHLDKSDFQFIEADLMDLSRLKEVIEEHDTIFHMAANPEVRGGDENTELHLKNGIIATYNLLEAMRVSNGKKIVFASTSTVYGQTRVIPIPEDYAPLMPISLYGASKLAGEGLITAYCHLFRMQAWIYRFANIVGHRATHGVIFDFINKLKWNPNELEILGDGTQEKPYLLVTDCVDGILFGLEHSNERVNTFNLGCSSSTSVDKIAKMVVAEMRLTNVRFRYTGGNRGWPGDVPQVRFDTSKMERLGWRPKYTSDEAVHQAIGLMLGKNEGWK
jgi:UDP-glucose 4-epimerase